MSELAVIERSEEPVTEASLVSALRSGGLAEGSICLVHPSLQSLGWVSGGALAVARSLVEAVGPEGTLVLPAHSSDLSDPATWSNPPVPASWWPQIRASLPAFDPVLTPTRGMGAVAESFRSFPGVLRSHHPASSFAAIGRDAEAVVAVHQLDDAFGENSPLRALYDLGAQTLLLGVGFASCTSLHLAERRALGPNQRLVPAGAPLRVEGVRKWVAYREPDVDSGDFERLGADFEREFPSAAFRVGQAPAKLLGIQPLVDFGAQWFQEHRV